MKKKVYCHDCEHSKETWTVLEGVYCGYDLNEFTSQPKVGCISMTALNEEGECKNYEKKR